MNPVKNDFLLKSLWASCFKKKRGILSLKPLKARSHKKEKLK
jgi:hypothetical protein